MISVKAQDEASNGVLMVVEQLRREVPGGSGTYAAGVLLGLRRLRQKGETLPPLTLFSTKPSITLKPTAGGDRSSGTSADPIVGSGFSFLESKLPSPLLTRGWDSGLIRAPSKFPLIHGVTLAVPRPAFGDKQSQTVVTVHDIAWREVPFAYPDHGREWHERALMRSIRAHHGFVVSSSEVATKLREAGAASGSVSVIEAGGDHLPPPEEGALEAVLSRLGITGGYILSVGTLEPRKNLQALMRAYSKVRRSLPDELPLVVVGPRGWGPEVRPPDGVVLAGMVSELELSSLYARARFLAYVPLLEGFGLPPLEAMHAGLPVLASPMPSLGNAALEVDPKNTSEIAEGLVAIATDGALRESLVDKGRARAASLTWERAASKHLELWSSVLRKTEAADSATDRDGRR